MLLVLLIYGFLVGITASLLAPLGPVGVLCVQRTLSKNFKSGFFSGLGAATADTMFAAVAFFSVTAILPFIERNMLVIKLVGGLIILAVGVRIMFSNPVLQIRRNRAGKVNLWQDFMSVFLVTLANPAFIFVFIALFALFGMDAKQMGLWGNLLVLAGVMAGCASWWMLVTFVVSRFRNKIRPRHLLWINRVSGALIIVLGVVMILLIFVNTPLDGIIG